MSQTMPLTPLLVLGNKLKSNLPSDIGLMAPEAAFWNNIVFVFLLGRRATLCFTVQFGSYVVFRSSR